MPGQERLKTEIMDLDLCSSCGACVNLCPYIKTINDRVRVIHPCGQEEGACYQICPKTGFDIREMDLAVFGREREDQALGVMSGIYYARARGKIAGAQYSGLTTSLASLALERGFISGAALTGGSVTKPRAVLARTVDEIKACAGSKYTGTPTLAEFNAAVKNGLTNLGLVGRPCQVAAVRRAQQSPLPGKQFAGPGSVALVLGLFCFWSLSPDFYAFLSQHFKGEEIIGMDIPVSGPAFTSGAGVTRREIEEIRPFIKNSCLSCFDSTSEWADLSVGSTENDAGWNTLIVRTPAGKHLIDQALGEGLVELLDYPQQRLPLLRKAVLNKKMRVLSQPGTVSCQPGYPRVPWGYQDKIKDQWGGVSR